MSFLNQVKLFLNSAAEVGEGIIDAKKGKVEKWAEDNDCKLLQQCEPDEFVQTVDVCGTLGKVGSYIDKMVQTQVGLLAMGAEALGIDVDKLKDIQDCIDIKTPCEVVENMNDCVEDKIEQLKEQYGVKTPCDIAEDIKNYVADKTICDVVEDVKECVGEKVEQVKDCVEEKIEQAKENGFKTPCDIVSDLNDCVEEKIEQIKENIGDKTPCEVIKEGVASLKDKIDDHTEKVHDFVHGSNDGEDGGDKTFCDTLKEGWESFKDKVDDHTEKVHDFIHGSDDDCDCDCGDDCGCGNEPSTPAVDDTPSTPAVDDTPTTPSADDKPAVNPGDQPTAPSGEDIPVCQPEWEKDQYEEEAPPTLDFPDVDPTTTPTVAPTTNPTVAPTTTPTVAPTTTPTVAPTGTPTGTPTVTPTGAPTTNPDVPSDVPSDSPSDVPSDDPNNGSNGCWLKEHIHEKHVEAQEIGHETLADIRAKREEKYGTIEERINDLPVCDGLKDGLNKVADFAEKAVDIKVGFWEMGTQPIEDKINELKDKYGNKTDKPADGTGNEDDSSDGCWIKDHVEEKIEQAKENGFKTPCDIVRDLNDCVEEKIEQIKENIGDKTPCEVVKDGWDAFKEKVDEHTELVHDFIHGPKNETETPDVECEEPPVVTPEDEDIPNTDGNFEDTDNVGTNPPAEDTTETEKDSTLCDTVKTTFGKLTNFAEKVVETKVGILATAKEQVETLHDKIVDKFDDDCDCGCQDDKVETTEPEVEDNTDSEGCWVKNHVEEKLEDAQIKGKEVILEIKSDLEDVKNHVEEKFDALNDKVFNFFNPSKENV